MILQFAVVVILSISYTPPGAMWTEQVTSGPNTRRSPELARNGESSEDPIFDLVIQRALRDPEALSRATQEKIEKAVRLAEQSHEHTMNLRAQLVWMLDGLLRIQGTLMEARPSVPKSWFHVYVAAIWLDLRTMYLLESHLVKTRLRCERIEAALRVLEGEMERRMISGEWLFRGKR